MTILDRARMAILPLVALALSGCVSLSKDPPKMLLNLTASEQAAAGSGSAGSVDTALAILDLQAPQKLNVTNVPVVTGSSSLAYLKDAAWVEKPARLFQRVLSDTIRAKGTRLLVGGTDLEFSAASKLSGTLDAMDYDAASSSVVVRFDAVLVDSDSRVFDTSF